MATNGIQDRNAGLAALSSEAVQAGGDAALRNRFIEAVGAFVDKVRPDPSILAVVVGGSLAYDVVWEKSDVDMTVVVRDQQLKNESYTLIEDGISLNVSMTTRSTFKRSLERNTGGSFGQSYFAKGTMVYTTDESLRDFFEEVKVIGEDDKALSMMIFACALTGTLDKCRKWLTACGDVRYAQYYFLEAAELVADMALCMQGEPSSRASVRKVLARNPDLLRPFYQEPLSHPFNAEEMAAAIDALDGLLTGYLPVISKPVIAFLSDGELKTGTLIARHFHQEPHFILNIFEWLVDKGVIEKATQTIRITPKGRQVFEEVGYLYLGG